MAPMKKKIKTLCVYVITTVFSLQANEEREEEKPRKTTTSAFKWGRK